MKILMFGRGVISTVYGWALERAGHAVEFYVRPGRAAAYGGAVDLDLHSQGLRRGSLSRLVGARDDLGRALLTSRELLPLLEARGVDLRRHRGWALLFRAPTWLTSSALAWATARLPLARVNLEAHSDPHAEEPREICRDTLAEARRLGVTVPRLEAAEPFFTRCR